jgi:hypothetical protein
MSRKVFTAGEVLAAADVNSFLMDQTVMSFAGTAARGSAIPSPTLGMYTHLEDTPPRQEFWNGSAWVSPSGMTLLVTSNPSAVSFININNVFSNLYENYVIYYNVTGTAGAGLNIRLRAAGTDSTTGYSLQLLQGNGSDVVATRDTTSGIFGIGTVRSTGRSFGVANISNPFVAAESSYTSTFHDPLSGAVVDIRSGTHSVASSFDGFTMSAASGTFSGNFRVYGVRI